MNDEALRQVYKTVVKLLCASLAWWGTHDGSRQRAFRGVHSTRSATRTVRGWRPNDNATYRQQRWQSL